MKDVPAVWNPSFPIIVVGAVDNAGNVPDFCQNLPGPNFPNAGVDVYAPGVRVCGDGPSNSGTSAGTSEHPC